MQPASTPVNGQAGGAGLAAPATNTQANAQKTATETSTGAKAVVNAPLVNVRKGPGTDYDVVATVDRGTEMDILGKNAAGTWWNVCCVNNTESAWIINEYVDTDGPVDSVPVTGGVGADTASAQPVTPVSPASSNSVNAESGSSTSETAAPAFSFDLKKQEQFPETNVVRIFLYVYSGNEALDGYTLRVTKNGNDLPVNGKSFGGQPAFTWPFQDARQRYQNLKVEFPDVTPGGIWVVQLIDGNGKPAGPAATFNLSDNDPLRELYVRYERH